MSEARARVRELVRQAKSELHSGNRDEALSLLKKALSMDPGSSAVTEAIMAMEKESAAASAPDLKPTPKQPQQKASQAQRQTERPSPARDQRPLSGPADDSSPSKPAPTPSSPPAEAPRPKPAAVPARPATSRMPGAIPQAIPRIQPRPSEPPSGRAAERPAAEQSRAPDHKPPVAAPMEPAAAPKGTGDRQAPESKPLEKKQEAPLDERLETLFESSEKAFVAGDEAGALRFLKQARELAPEDLEVRARVRQLQRKLKARNLVSIGMRKLAEGGHDQALAAAREAFALWSETPGLEDLVSGLERAAGAAPAPGAGEPTARPKQARRPAERIPADEYVRRVREQIQLSAFPSAAEIAAEGLEQYPAHDLLTTFVEKFQKMGLLPK